MSSSYKMMNLCFICSMILFIMRMNCLGVFARPNGRTRNLYKPNLVVKAVFCLAAVAMQIWWKPAAKSNFVNQQDLCMEVSKSSKGGRGLQSVTVIAIIAPHQQKTFPSWRNGSIRVDALRQSRHRHPGGGLLRAQRHYDMSHCISPSDRRFAVSSCSVGLLFQTNTLALWPTVTIRQNGFIGYTLGSGLQCNGWRCENLCSRSFYI